MNSIFSSMITGLDEAIDDARQKKNPQKSILSGSYEKESCRASEFRLVFRAHSQYDERN